MAAKSKALVKRRSVELTPVQPLTQADVDDRSIPTLHRAQVMVVPQALEVAQALDSINARPMGDRILVLPLPNDTRYGSILIPANSQEEQTCGIVVAVGKANTDVARGNYVAFAKFAGRKTMVGNVELLQISSEDVLIVVGPDAPETQRPQA